MPLPLTMYGATHCEDTQHVRERLTEWCIPFGEVNIDHDPIAEQFVIFINSGQRRTPTLVFGDGSRKTILTEPSDDLLRTTLLSSGFVPGYQQHPSNTDDRTTLNFLLFDIRGQLVPLVGIAMLVCDGQIDLPQPITDWLRKWQPAMKAWQQTQDWVRLQNEWVPGESINTNQLLAKLVEGMQYVPDAAAEARSLIVPESLREELFVTSALHAIERLERIYTMLISDEYRHMVGWSVS